MITIEEQLERMKESIQAFEQIMNDESLSGVLKRMSLYVSGALGDVYSNCSYGEEKRVLKHLIDYVGKDSGYQFSFSKYSHQIDIRYKREAIGTLYIGGLAFHFKKIESDITEINQKIAKLKASRLTALYTDEDKGVNKSLLSAKKTLLRKEKAKQAVPHLEDLLLGIGPLKKVK